MALIQIDEPISKNSENANNLIIGIDLGTTNSLVGAVIDEQVKLFCDDKNNDIHPSIVEFDNFGNLLGVANQINFQNKNSHFISSIKRLMGKSFSDIANLNYLEKKYLPNHAQNSNNPENSSGNIQNNIAENIPKNIAENIILKIGEKNISSIEICAEILKYLKKIAEDNLLQPVSKVVITVPAYFDEGAKNATKQSAFLAGLEVIRLVNEPTASALAYGLDNNSQGLYLVYDLGGGTFDVSILKITNGVFKVLGVAGNNNLGGDDFDLLLKEYGFKNPRQAKENLSFNDDYSEGNIKISRCQFVNLIDDKITKTVRICENLVDDLDLDINQLNGIILVGGSSRIPLIKEKLIEKFGEKILTNIDPDRVVAIGACHQAHNLSGAKKNLLLDVNPLSLGIEMMGGIVDKIIYRNSTIPITKTKEFTTYADNQTAMKLHIVQGENEFAKDCRSLAEFEIKNIPPMIAGLARVAVTFSLDADGLLTVSGEEKFTKSRAKIVVKPSFSLSDEQIKNMLINSLKNSQSDIKSRLLAQEIVDANHDLQIIKKDLKNKDLKISPNLRRQINSKISKLENLISENNNIKELQKAKEELISAVEPMILEKVNRRLSNQVIGKKIDNF
jgi:molecular chaperone HscA